jgi:hypothetical protein
MPIKNNENNLKAVTRSTVAQIMMIAARQCCYTFIYTTITVTRTVPDNFTQILFKARNSQMKLQKNLVDLMDQPKDFRFYAFKLSF